MKIRKAKVEDLKALIDLGYEFLSYEEKQHDESYNPKYIYTKDSKHYILKRIKEARSYFMVAEENGQLIGFLVGSICPRLKSRPNVVPSLLEELFIQEKYRGQGIGQEMFYKFADWCKRKKATKMRVDMFYKNNKAKKFYKKSGFKEHTVIYEKDI